MQDLITLTRTRFVNGFPEVVEAKVVSEQLYKLLTMPKSRVAYPIDLTDEKIRITLPFASTETKFYSPQKPHMGVDYSPYPGAYGEPIYATLNGKVFKSVNSSTGKGNYIVVKSESPISAVLSGLSGKNYSISVGDTIYTVYAHLREIWVGVDEDVFAGQQIGTMGDTGLAAGAHLHYELRLGDYDQKQYADGHSFLVDAMNILNKVEVQV